MTEPTTGELHDILHDLETQGLISHYKTNCGPDRDVVFIVNTSKTALALTPAQTLAYAQGVTDALDYANAHPDLKKDK